MDLTCSSIETKRIIVDDLTIDFDSLGNERAKWDFKLFSFVGFTATINRSFSSLICAIVCFARDFAKIKMNCVTGFCMPCYGCVIPNCFPNFGFWCDIGVTFSRSMHSMCCPHICIFHHRNCHLRQIFVWLIFWMHFAHETIMIMCLCWKTVQKHTETQSILEKPFRQLT